MTKIIKILLTITIVTILNTFVLTIYKLNTTPSIKNISLIDYDKNGETLTIEIEKKHGILYDYNYNCNAVFKNEIITNNSQSDICVLTLPKRENYQIYLSNKYHSSSKLNIIDYIDNNHNFTFTQEEIYLTINGTKDIEYKEEFIIPVDKIYEFYSTDSSVAKIEGTKITGITPGIAYIKIKNRKEELKVTVTDLINDYTLSKTKKDIIPCHKYTEEEAETLDKSLEYFVNEAGYQTRAGAVAAGRFLTLQLKYRIPYFYENGRINDSGVHKADGEGRYYKKGMYLSENKYKDIIYTYADKAIWGCPLKNGTNNTKYGFIAGKKMPNGLDCSGFVSWALVQAGFDPGDVGAGENEGIYQLTDTGEFTTLTKDLALSGKIKTGDLFNFWGHIALIIGQDKNNYYVAESLPHLGGVIAKTYSKQTVANTFEFVVFMDKFYKKDGNLTDYWE